MMQEYDLFDMAIELEEMRLDTNVFFQELDGMVEDDHRDVLESFELMKGIANKMKSVALTFIQILDQQSILTLSLEEEEVSPRSMNTLSTSQVEELEYEEIWDEFMSNLTLEIDGSHTPTGDEPFREQLVLIPFDFDQVREVDELDKMIGEKTHQDDSSKTPKIEHKADLVLCRRPPVVTGARPLDINSPRRRRHRGPHSATGQAALLLTLDQDHEDKGRVWAANSWPVWPPFPPNEKARRADRKSVV